MSAVGEFLFAAPAQRSTGSIVRWWERRRFAYNLGVAAAGAFTYVYGTVIALMPPGGGVDYPPLSFPLVALALANVCYFLGPATEIVIDKLWGERLTPAGPLLYRMGLTFSVGLALLPALVITLIWVVRIAVGVVG